MNEYAEGGNRGDVAFITTEFSDEIITYYNKRNQENNNISL